MLHLLKSITKGFSFGCKDGYFSGMPTSCEIYNHAHIHEPVLACDMQSWEQNF